MRIVRIMFIPEKTLHLFSVRRCYNYLTIIFGQEICKWPWHQRIKWSSSMERSRSLQLEVFCLVLGDAAIIWCFHGWLGPLVLRSRKVWWTLNQRNFFGMIWRSYFHNLTFTESRIFKLKSSRFLKGIGQWLITLLVCNLYGMNSLPWILCQLVFAKGVLAMWMVRLGENKKQTW